MEHGEFTRVIIAAVVAHGPIRAGELVKKLVSWGWDTNKHVVSVRLAELGNKGKIERVGRGLYEGV
jgi:hypothetical protein